ncbi:MAG TPA: sulfatase [Thermoguttaceae bacterium]|nr:sulfatase [Thermoguttaceae bacterium]
MRFLILFQRTSVILFLCLFGLITTAQAAGRPNILFCIADDATFAHMGAYGCDWVKTPAFDRVAREGILFHRAYTPNAKCAPSRSCIITGRNSWQLEAACNHWPFFPAKFKSVVEVLGENGYQTGMTGKGWAPGIAKTADGKGRQLVGRPYQKRRTQPPAGGIAPTDYAANFQDFLAEVPQGEPWFFWYGGYEPHRGYEYLSGVKKGGKSIDEIDQVPGFWPDNEVIRNDMLDYAFEIEYFDTHLGRMLATLEQRGELENTLVVVTADNGMPFPRVKGQEYEMSNHLPLAIMWPGGIKRPGRKVDDYVNFIDLAPTFLQLAGLNAQQTGMQPITGRSLLDVLTSEKEGQVTADRDHVLIGKERHDIGRPNDWGYPIRGIVKGRMLYLKNFEPTRWPGGNPQTGYLNCDGSPTKTEILKKRRDGSDPTYWKQSFGRRPVEEMYDVVDDPYCLTNLADEPGHQELKKSLEKQLVGELTAQEDPRILGHSEVFDNYPYANRNEANFYERYMGGEKLRAGWVNETDFEKEPIK